MPEVPSLGSGRVAGRLSRPDEYPRTQAARIALLRDDAVRPTLGDLAGLSVDR